MTISTYTRRLISGRYEYGIVIPTLVKRQDQKLPRGTADTIADAQRALLGTTRAGLCKNLYPECGAAGECLRCDAEAGEACHFKREYDRWFVQEVVYDGEKEGFQAVRLGIGGEEDEQGSIFTTPEEAWRDAHWNWAEPTAAEEG